MANLDKRMGAITVTLDLKKHPDIAAIIECQFDTTCDIDEKEISIRLLQAQMVKRICIAKTLLFIPDYLVGKFLLPKGTVDKRVAIQKKIWAYLRGRIETQEILMALAGVGV